MDFREAPEEWVTISEQNARRRLAANRKIAVFDLPSVDVDDHEMTLLVNKRGSTLIRTWYVDGQRQWSMNNSTRKMPNAVGRAGQIANDFWR